MGCSDASGRAFRPARDVKSVCVCVFRVSFEVQPLVQSRRLRLKARRLSPPQLGWVSHVSPVACMSAAALLAPADTPVKFRCFEHAALDLLAPLGCKVRDQSL